MQAFADDPAKFIQTFLESQSRDLESILASGPSEGASVRTEDLHRSDFWKMGWVEEAVAVCKYLFHTLRTSPFLARYFLSKTSLICSLCRGRNPACCETTGPVLGRHSERTVILRLCRFDVEVGPSGRHGPASNYSCFVFLYLCILKFSAASCS